ncbi:MAG TPA: hypothetical protein VGK34_10755 [Armatimonadota bacterium]
MKDMRSNLYVLYLACGMTAISLLGQYSAFAKPVAQKPNAVPLTAHSAKTAKSALASHGKYTAAQIDHERYPYHSRRFTKFVDESMQFGQMGDASLFYNWMETSVRSSGLRLGPRGETIDEMLLSRKQHIASLPASKRADAELAACAEVHKLIKTIIPRFSLQHGFEFYNAMSLGERQCFLQSVIIAGLLQGMGIDAGVVMVYANERGQESNNGHAIDIVKLRNGHDVQVDASEQAPFAHHLGLFVKIPTYRYVMPVFDKKTGQTIRYRAAGGDVKLPAYRVRTLGCDFLKSQFWYYRGERTPGALIETPKTDKGMASSEEYLKRSVRECPGNPLAVYMLGRVMLARGNTHEARKLIERAYNLYSIYGWIPQGPREYYLRVKS